MYSGPPHESRTGYQTAGLVLGLFGLIILGSAVQSNFSIPLAILSLVLFLVARAVWQIKPKSGPNQGQAAPETAINATVSAHPPDHTPDHRFALHGRFALDYTDADGERTKRVVDAQNVDLYGSKICLEAYCHLRKGPRMFRADRIHEMVDSATGEVAPPDVGRWLINRATTHH